ncbi:MAG: acetamidase/formamidase family protein [Chloroflexota bacterium]
MTDHSLTPERLHFAWDNSLEPTLRIQPGDSVTFETWDASGHQVQRTWTSHDAANRTRTPGIGHALTGPVAIEGARSGQTLVVEIEDVRPAAWGYTSFSPGRGLLPDDFPSAYIRIWDLEDGQFGRGLDGVRIPLAPFCGVMGVALAEIGAHATAPPRRVGGNMDVRQLTAGATLYLPIEVDGALFSVGDAHGAQGDGEVCITAIEMDSVTRLRFSLSDVAIREPEFHIPRPPTAIGGAYHACTAHAPDLMLACQNATRWLIEWLCHETHLSAEDAYVLASVAAELRISQVVDAPNWTVTAFFPLSIFEDAMRRDAH